MKWFLVAFFSLLCVGLTSAEQMEGMPPGIDLEALRQKAKTKALQDLRNKGRTEERTKKRVEECYPNENYGWLGVGIQDINQVLSDYFGLRLRNTKGVLITNILPGAPAEKAGLKEDDFIKFYNGEKVVDSTSLLAKIACTRVGKKVEMKIIRGGKKRTIEVTIGRRLKDTPLKVKGPVQIMVAPQIERGSELSEEDSSELRDSVSLLFRTEKSDVYLNEIIPVTIKLYTYRAEMQNLERYSFYQSSLYDPRIEHERLLADTFKETPAHVRESVRIGRVRYDVTEYKTNILGTSPGRFTLGPVHFTFSKYDTRTDLKFAVEVPITVMPLPEERTRLVRARKKAEEERVKKEVVAGRLLVIKGLYLGMDIEDARENLIKRLNRVFTVTKRGNDEYAIVGRMVEIIADSNKKVKKIVFSPPVTDKLFNSSALNGEQFAQEFVNAYHIKNMEPFSEAANLIRSMVGYYYEYGWELLSPWGYKFRIYQDKTIKLIIIPKESELEFD